MGAGHTACPFYLEVQIMETEIGNILGTVISSYTRAEAIEDGILVDVTETAAEAGFKWPTAITRAAYERYVAVPPGLSGQDIQGRLWDILRMLWVTIRTNKSVGDCCEFKLLVLFSDTADWQDNEVKHPAEEGGLRLVTLNSICGPGDDGEPVITIMLPTES